MSPLFISVILMISRRKWQQRRKITNTLEFHYDTLEKFILNYTVYAVKTNSLVQGLWAEAGTGEIIEELHPIITSAAIEIIQHMYVVFNKTSYLLWKSVVVQSSNVLSTFFWNFMDLF
ncbi:hypothetical protein HCN44_004524 [Aphidius gifuensis]|uniref:Gustatory receptor n=1 Tax=Aphidius gifuensis TaxID=684658 RepID=A0A834XZ94_APHGI|nr:hypothetical protein HCN44_004524 [Aphidius gifuensis]